MIGAQFGALGKGPLHLVAYTMKLKVALVQGGPPWRQSGPMLSKWATKFGLKLR